MGKSTNSTNCEENHHLLNPSDSEENTETKPKKSTRRSSESGLGIKMTKLSAYALARFMASVTLKLIVRFWGLCATGTLTLLLLYYFYGGFVSLALLIIGVLGLLYNAQDMLLYSPAQPQHSRIFVENSSTFGLQSEMVYVKCRDGVQINMMFIKQNAEKLKDAPTFIFFHGNAGNIGHRLLNASALYSYNGANILLVEYRGYGKSSGKPSEKGMYVDAQAAMDFIMKQKDINQQKLVVFGRSLGGAVAIQLCSEPYYASSIMCLVVENTFTSLPAIGRHIFDFKVLKYLPTWCFKNKFPSTQRIKKVKVPTLFLSGLADQLIPPRMMQELYDASGSSLKRVAYFADGTHNETWQCQGYYEAINRYLVEISNTAKEAHDSHGVYSVDMPFSDGATFQL